MQLASAAESPNKHLKVTFRRVQTERAGGERILAVFCPRTAGAVGLAECRKCPHCRGLCIDPSDRQTFLRCTADGAGAGVEAPAEPRPESPEAGGGSHPTLADVMTRDVRSVTPETSIGALTRIFLEEAIGAVPVVDARGTAIGLVSKTDVLRRFYGDDTDTPLVSGEGGELSLRLADPDATVRDIMTCIVFALPREAPLSRAAALMSYEGIHRIVVTHDGAAVGIVSSLDVLRWMARQDGYVVPERTHGPRAKKEELG